MPGMNSGVDINSPVVVAALKAAVLHQGLIALLILLVLVLAWIGVRAWQRAGARSSSPTRTPGRPALSVAEPGWRRLLRIGFGLLWVFDGILQAQPKMAVGLPSQVIEPTAASSPGWVQHLVNWAATTWSYHPIQAGAAAVWIQVGIGLWLLVAARGAWSRLAGAASVSWGLVVWVFGESFGGIFAPGQTWLFGAPGAVLLYCAAGALIALPERTWYLPRLGRLVLAGMGLFLAGMAVLQAWPGRGFWHGAADGKAGTLTSMARTMATTPQPHFLSAWVGSFASFIGTYGFAVNLFVVTALTLIAVAFLSGRPQLIRPALIVFAVLCLADWVLIQDLGFLGGLGTDPNSMIPFILLAVAGYLALVNVRPAEAEASVTAAPANWRDRFRLASLRGSVAEASFRTVASVCAVGIIVLGAAPMAVAQANPVADPILAQAISGQGVPLDGPAPAFGLTDQHGRLVTLADLRGKVVLLTFLDDTCSVDCPLIAQEFRIAGQLLGADLQHVELVAINYNPLYTQLSYIRAFDNQEGLAGQPHWLYLTGSRAQLEHVWSVYNVISPQLLPAGAMLAHGDYAFVIDQTGNVRRELGFDPGPGTQATKSSFAAELTDAARQLLGQA
jgi:cytochrome oxidase Cu insertion factor (SCO1/SenC/PrrC family)